MDDRRPDVSGHELGTYQTAGCTRKCFTTWVTGGTLRSWWGMSDR